MVITKELREKPLIESTTTENLIEKILPPKTIEINIGTSDVSTSSAPENNENNNTTTPQSFIFKFVFAEENNVRTSDVLNTETTTQIINETSESTTTLTTNEISSSTTNQTSTINEAQNQTSTETTSETTTQTTTEISTTTTPPKTLFDIHYTFDGQNWNYLGSLNSENWKDISFEIPVKDWVDISKIQIKINSMPDTDYYLYLESMWLEVEYISGPQKTEIDDISVLNKSLVLDPNFDYQKLIDLRGIANNKIIALLSNGEIWFFDLLKERQIKISSDANPEFKIGIKNNYAFFLSKDKTKIYYLNLNDLNLKEKELTTQDFSQRILLPLPELNLTLILENNQFIYQLPSIGEIFSDENSIVKSNFIKVFGLNRILNEETLNNLGYYEKDANQNNQ